MSLLYSKKHLNDTNSGHYSEEYDIIEFVPSLKSFYMQGETHSIRTTFVRCYFQLMTFGKAKLVCAINQDGETVHTSYVVPKCFKFPMLSVNDYIIGPCFTRPDYRGQGIYPRVLEYICSHIGNIETLFYMCVDESNLPSIKGIEKSGFKKCGSAKKTRFLKRYYFD